MLQRPEACYGCALDSKASGFAPPEGPTSSPLLFLGEALGETEAALGRPFVGDADSMLQRLFNLLGWERSAQRIANVVSCHPPNNWMDGTPQAPWFYPAIDHCRVHRDPVLAEPHKVVVAMGSTALKVAGGLLGQKKIRVQDFHGSPLRDPEGRFWIVPTYHPSFLQRGAHNLIGTVLWDLQQAERIAREGKKEDPGTLIVDPPIEWFRSWVSTVRSWVESKPWAFPISVDVETPDKAHGKDEGEITVEDRSFQILRVNVACHPDEGITVPFSGPYIEELKRLLAPEAILWLWNKAYDIPRLIQAGVVEEAVDARAIDLMWLWHYLQSDVPRGLGFVAPFYSGYGAWKHLADVEAAKYAAIDALQTHRIGFGVLRDLKKLGMYAGAMRHVHQLHHLALLPAMQVGVKVDRERLTIFDTQLTEKAVARLATLEQVFPDALRNLTPRQGMTKKPLDNILHAKASAFTRKGEKRKGKEVSPLKQELYAKAYVVEREISKVVRICRVCGQTEVPKAHRCKGVDGKILKDAVAQVEEELQGVVRYFWCEPFNPDAPQQVLSYIKWRKHLPGKAKKTRKDTTNRETLDRLARSTQDPFYVALLDYRAVQKVKGTYVDGTFRRLDSEDRIHPEPTFKPSTMRLSYQNPNITNVVQDRGGAESLAAGFRRTIVASPGCRLLEVDFSGSEAVDVGWYARAPKYIKLAKLGVHAGLASHVLGRPYDPNWSDQDLGAYFKEIKKSKQPEVEAAYNTSKRFVHGYSYGLTIPGMVLQFPEVFRTIKIAEKYEVIFRGMAPEIPAWQRTIRELAFKQHYLGGADHPFNYKHWFWSVFQYKKITAGQYWAIVQKVKLRGGSEASAPVAQFNGQYFKVSLGEDGKRCVAFYPQSTTAGKLKEVMLRLFTPGEPSYIGDAYYGKTPLRGPIHDSLLVEIPIAQFDLVASVIVMEMQRPILQMPLPAEWEMGSHLVTGVSAKSGLDWADMEDLDLKKDLGVGGDTIRTVVEEEEAEEWDDVGRMVS